MTAPGTSPRSLDPRLLPGGYGWWAVLGDRIALLPAAAVRHGRLVEEATRQLAAQDFFAPAPSPSYAVTVLTATACNLGCSYCFQNTGAAPAGSSAPPRIAASTLTPAMTRKVTAFVERQLAALGYTSVSLLLFGGEPLMNPAGCLALLRGLSRSGLATAEATTNGVLLTEPLARELADAGLQRVQVTFDGARPTHDRIRVTRNGRGTYDTILTNILAAAAATPLRFHLRVNVSHRNIDTLGDLVDDLTAVVPADRTSVNLALVDDVGLGYANHTGYSEAVAESFIAAYRTCIARGVMPALAQVLRHCLVCAAVGGRTGAVVNADGALYSC